MKILYWTGLFWPHIGGVEVLSLQLISAMQERGYEFIVLTSKSNSDLSDKEDYKGISIYRFPFHKGVADHNLKEIEEIKLRVIELKKKFKPDLVHINSIDASIFFHQITDNVADNIPTLFTVHSLPPFVVDNNTLLRKMIASSKWITTASDAMLTTVRKLIPEIVSSSSLIYYGLSMPEIEPTPIPFDPPRLLSIGRIVKEKGFDIALDAFAKIITLFPMIRLVIAGDGQAKSDLENKAEKLGISSFTKFIGWVSPENVPDLINSSTIVIIPSKWQEPFGLVALQAAQMARPVIAANVGGLPEIVDHQKTGLLFDNENSNNLSEHIIFLLKNPEMAIQMGQTARKKVMVVFRFERFVNEYDELYKKLISSGG